MARYLLTEPATADLQEIKDYIAQDSVSASRKIIGELKKAIRGLAEMPGKGHNREDLTEQAVFFWPVNNYLIVYRPETNPLEVVRVIHGRRDLEEILKN